MSKKMLKRSLALGALMAFVITGQAWAAGEAFKVTETKSFTNELSDYVANVAEDGRIYVIDARELPDGETITFGEEVNAKVIGSNENVCGIQVYDTWRTSAGNLIANKAVNLTVATSTGMYAEAIKSHDRAELNFEDDLSIAVNGGTYARGITAQDNGVVNVKGDTTITMQGDGHSYAVYALGTNAPDSKVSLVGNTNILVETNIENNTNVIDAEGVFAEDGGKVELNGKDKETQITVVSKQGRASAVSATGTGSQVKLDNANVNLVATAKNEEVAYAIHAQNGGEVAVKAKEAYFKGGIIIKDGGTVNIDVDNFTWDISGTGEPNTVTELIGTGTIIVAAEEDTVEAEAGTANLTVQATGAYAEKIASANDQADALQDLADQVYGAETVTVTQVGTEEGEITGAVTAKVGEDGNVVAGSIKEAVNTTNQAIGEAAVNLKAHYRAHMNDMNKRMGELRMANGEAGVWTRMVRGETEFEGAKSQYNQYQLGYDEKLSVDKRWTVGAAVTFAEGEGSFGKGSTEDDSTAFAIYGSKLNNDGTFVDLIARYARLESDITMGANKADYSTNGYSVSAEFGKRIQQGNGLWIEPQVELTYGTVDSAEYTINGKDVTVGDMDSIIGRVGFSLGKDIKQGNVYARASYLYDFDGETETAFGKNGVTRTIEEDLGGGWWEVGVGANINLSKATYVYADVEKTFGGEIDTNWQWNLGVRYSF